MGIFRTVYFVRPCRKCGTQFRAQAQFDYDENDAFQSYEEGDFVGAGPAELEGYAKIHCFECQQQWIASAHATEFEILATAVESGEITARFAIFEYAGGGRPFKETQLRVAPLTGDEIRAVAAATRALTNHSFSAKLGDAGIGLWDRSGRVYPAGDLPQNPAWWPRFLEQYRERMKTLGWDPFSGDDVPLDLDQQGRIHVRAR